MKKHSRLITIVSLVIGFALFLFVIKQSGSQQLLTRVREAGTGLIWIILVSGLRPMVRALAWLRCMSATDRRIGFLAVWRARLIGDAVGNITTAGPLLAEPARLVFLSGRIPLTSAASSLSIELLTYFASCCLLMIAGLALLLCQFAISYRLQMISLAALTLLLAAMATMIVIIHQRWSPVRLLGKIFHRNFSTDHRLIGKIKKQLQRAQELEVKVFDFYRQHPRDFAIVCLCEIGFHLLALAEIAISLWLMKSSINFSTTFIFEAVNRLISIIFAFVPARVGVDEAGTGLLAGALGLAALTGVTMAVYRKLRVLFWTAVGGLLLASPLKRTAKIL